MGFLRLKPECRMILGRSKACIYNTLSGDMIALNTLESRFTAETQTAKTVEESLAQHPEDDQCRLIGFLDKLQEKGLADIYERPYYVKPLERGLTGGFASFFEPNQVTLLFLEVNRDCPLDCIFCHVPDIFGRGTGCGRYGDQQGEPLTEQERLGVVAQALELGTRELFITGGDPLLSDEWEALARVALDGGVERVTVWTSGAPVIPETWLRTPRVRFALQVFSFIEAVHDEMAGTRGAFASLMANLLRMKECASAPLLSLVVTRHNEDHYQQSRAFYQQFTQWPVELRPVYPVGLRSLSPVDPRGSLLGVRRWFLRVDPGLFSLTQRCHTCFHGKLAVAEDGRVLPCVVGRAWTMGDVHREELWQVLADGRHKRYWELTKSSLAKCSGCEFRFGCFDCRVIQGNGQSLTEVYHCDYELEGTSGFELGSR